MHAEHQQMLQQCEDDLETAIDAIAQGRKLQAVESLTYAIDVWPEGSRTTQRAQRCIVEALCLRADCAVDSTGKFAAAMADLAAALEIQPDSSPAHVRCAQYMARSVTPPAEAVAEGTGDGLDGQSAITPAPLSRSVDVPGVKKALMHCIAALVVGCEVEELLSLAPLLEDLSKKIGQSLGV